MPLFRPHNRGFRQATTMTLFRRNKRKLKKLKSDSSSSTPSQSQPSQTTAAPARRRSSSRMQAPNRLSQTPGTYDGSSLHTDPLIDEMTLQNVQHEVSGMGHSTLLALQNEPEIAQLWMDGTAIRFVGGFMSQKIKVRNRFTMFDCLS